MSSAAPAPLYAGMRVLVTGSDGLVGSAVREVGPSALPGAAFIFLGGRSSGGPDLRDAAATAAAFAAAAPTHILHLAARVGGLFLNMRCPVELGRCVEGSARVGPRE